MIKCTFHSSAPLYHDRQSNSEPTNCKLWHVEAYSVDMVYLIQLNPSDSCRGVVNSPNEFWCIFPLHFHLAMSTSLFVYHQLLNILSLIPSTQVGQDNLVSLRRGMSHFCKRDLYRFSELLLTHRFFSNEKLSCMSHPLSTLLLVCIGFIEWCSCTHNCVI